MYLLPVSMTCFCLTVMYIHITLEVRIRSVCPTAGQINVRKFSLRFQGPKICTSLSSEIQNDAALFSSKLKSFFLGINTLKLS